MYILDANERKAVQELLLARQHADAMLQGALRMVAIQQGLPPDAVFDPQELAFKAPINDLTVIPREAKE